MEESVKNFRFTDLEHELWSLGRYRELMESQLASMKEEELQRACHFRSELASNIEAGQLAIAEAYVVGEVVLPRFYRGSFLITLWAVFESGVIEIADYLAEERKSPLTLRDLRGRDQKEQWTKYFIHIVKYSLGFSNDQWEKLEELRQIRNVLAHSNGRLDLLEENIRRKIERWCTEKNGLISHHDLLHISAEYVCTAHILVTESLTSLIKQVRTDFSP
jgi:hypothetical protein